MFQLGRFIKYLVNSRGYIEIQFQIDNDFEPIVQGASYYFGHLNRNPFVIKPTGHRQQSNIENFPLGAKLT